jgi:hypothetical protein
MLTDLTIVQRLMCRYEKHFTNFQHLSKRLLPMATLRINLGNGGKVLGRTVGLLME